MSDRGGIDLRSEPSARHRQECLCHRNTGRRAAARRAFTLIEVLATLVVIGIILPVAMHGISLAVWAAGNARMSAEAASLAEGKLSELAATTDFFPGSQSGDFGPDHPEYQWQAQTTSIDLGLEEMTVTVSWQSRGATRTLRVSTWAYRTAMGGSGL